MAGTERVAGSHRGPLPGTPSNPASGTTRLLHPQRVCTPACPAQAALDQEGSGHGPFCIVGADGALVSCAGEEGPRTPASPGLSSNTGVC